MNCSRNLLIRLSMTAALWLGIPGAGFDVPILALSASAQAAEPAKTLPDFASIVESNRGAVVNITVLVTQETAEEVPPVPPNDPFFEFFRRFQIPQPQVPRRALASGFIVSADGYILTNAHAVSAAADVTVKLADRREFKAKVIGVDEMTDIAVLRIDARGLPAVKLGDPRSTRVGEWVLAIGSPFGLENTVTAGIVSAT